MHVLQREAKKTELREIDRPADAEYDFAAGVWRSKDCPSSEVLSSSAA